MWFDGREPGLGGYLLRPLLDDAALNLDAAAAHAAGQVVMVRGGPALPVQGLAGRVADAVDHALLAEYLQVAVDGGEADGLALAAQLGVDLLRAAEPGQAGKRARPRPTPASSPAPGCRADDPLSHFLHS